MDTDPNTESAGPLSIRFAPPQETATAAVLCLVAMIAADAASIAEKANQLRVIAGFESGTATESDAAMADLVTGLVGLGTMPVFLGTVVGFLLWFYRGVRFARQLDPNPQGPSAGWAVGSFFVPFANLVVPVRAALASWRTTFEAERHTTGQLAGAVGTSVVTGWWGMWILANFVYNAGMKVWLRPQLHGEEPTLEQLRLGTIVEMGGDVLSIVAAVLCIMMILQLSGAQRRVAELSPAA